MNDNSITIITICFNNLDELKDTIHSVDFQVEKPYEHWIIDGSNNTYIQDFLATNPQPPYRKWLSEPDKGISDAFNKGVDRATGDIIVMLNSADSLDNETVLQTVRQAFEKDNHLQWLHAKYTLLRGGLFVLIGKPFDYEKLYRGMRSISHQTMYVKRQLHTKYGNYNLDLKIAMDYDFLCYISKEKNTFLQQPLARFAPGGISTNQYLNSLKEARSVYEKHFGYCFKLVLWQWRLKILYYLLNSPIGHTLYKIKVKLQMENI
jgi:glycosyltransferase involved in cell wall biosynthesis